jgi:hypothetical protein
MTITTILDWRWRMANAYCEALELLTASILVFILILLWLRWPITWAVIIYLLVRHV